MEKRRAARALHTALAHADAGGALTDGRAERRRQRLVKELKEGRAGKPLAAIDVLTHAAELLALGETLASLDKRGIKPRKVQASEELTAAARRVQAAYALPTEVFALIGLSLAPTRDPETP